MRPIRAPVLRECRRLLQTLSPFRLQGAFHEEPADSGDCESETAFRRADVRRGQQRPFDNGAVVPAGLRMDERPVRRFFPPASRLRKMRKRFPDVRAQVRQHLRRRGRYPRLRTHLRRILGFILSRPSQRLGAELRRMELEGRRRNRFCKYRGLRSKPGIGESDGGFFRRHLYRKRGERSERREFDRPRTLKNAVLLHYEESRRV